MLGTKGKFGTRETIALEFYHQGSGIETPRCYLDLILSGRRVHDFVILKIYTYFEVQRAG